MAATAVPPAAARTRKLEGESESLKKEFEQQLKMKEKEIESVKKEFEERFKRQEEEIAMMKKGKTYEEVESTLEKLRANKHCHDGRKIERIRE